jgi:hypothetical protein
MHYYSFVLLSLLLVVLTMRLRLISSFALSIALLLSVMVWQFVYLAIGVRRFYLAHSRRRLLAWIACAIIAVVVNLLNSLFLTAVQFAGAAFAILRL